MGKRSEGDNIPSLLLIKIPHPISNLLVRLPVKRMSRFGFYEIECWNNDTHLVSHSSSLLISINNPPSEKTYPYPHNPPVVVHQPVQPVEEPHHRIAAVALRCC